MAENIKDEFLNMRIRQDVAKLVGIEDKSLRYILYVIKPDNLYNEFTLKQKNGKERGICSPNQALKSIQKKLANILDEIYDPKACAYGFIKSKDFIKNAENHVKKNCILNIDLKDFFSQINFGRVRGLFLSSPFNLPNEVATTIAQICCYKGSLPQGGPTSPIITNMICKSLDNRLMRIAKKYKCHYTRYADDITFSTYLPEMSSNIVVSRPTLELGVELKSALSENGFEVNDKKIYFANRFSRHEVTGIIVNKKINVKRKYVKKIRALLHNCIKTDVLSVAKEYIKRDNIAKQNLLTDEIKLSDWFQNVLKGKIQFIGQVKGRNSFTYLKMAEKLNEVFKKDIFDVSLLIDFESKIKKNVFVFSGEETLTQGSGFLLDGYGLITNYHVVEKEAFFSISDSITHELLGKRGLGLYESTSDKNIDYALFEFNREPEENLTFSIGDSENLKIGDQVIIAGFPNYQEGDSPFIQICSVVGTTPRFHGAPLYRVSGRIVHGASGGIVLNEKKEVIGLIKGGVASLAEEDESIDHGFVPIFLILNDINSKLSATIAKKNITENHEALDELAK